MKSEDEIPFNVRWEIARINQIDSVLAESTEYDIDCLGRACISFELETDILLEPAEKEILDIEPVVFRYPTPETVGFRAPEVLSGRENFPRDLLHLFPSTNEEPVCLCLARSGLQPVYDSFGITGVISRLLDWFADAKTETLYEEGWDPVPIQDIHARILGYLDTEALQNFAYEHNDEKFKFIAAEVIHLSETEVFVNAAQPFIDTTDTNQLQVIKDQMELKQDLGKCVRTTIPAIFVWPARDLIESKPRFNTWCDINSFRDGLRQSQLLQTLEDAFYHVDVLFRNDAANSKPPDLDASGTKSLIVIVGLWRPVPIDPTVVGLSTVNGARCLEIRAFCLQRPLNETDRWSKKTSLLNFIGLDRVNSSTLKAVSGLDGVGSMALLGAGALGSAYADYAVRGGCDQMTVIDHDRMFPHNIARHRGYEDHVYFKKTEVLNDLARKCLASAKITRFDEDIISLSDENLKQKFCNVLHVIDATANPLVRRRLSVLKDIDLPVMRTEIFHKGRLGVSLLTKLGTTQNLNCLFHQLVSLAMCNRHVRDWLKYETSRTYMDEELLIGFGCRSRTTKLPLYVVDAHASSSFALAHSRLRAIDSPIIALYVLDDEGMVKGVEVIPAEPVVLFNGPETTGWSVIVAENVLRRMKKI